MLSVRDWIAIILLIVSTYFFNIFLVIFIVLLWILVELKKKNITEKDLDKMMK